MRGLEKAAALLLAMGEDMAGEVLKHLRQTEIQKVTSAMVKLEQLKTGEVEVVAKDFIAIAEEHSVMGMDGGQYMKNVLARTLGPEKASEMMENFLLHGGEAGLEAVRMMDPRMIADLVKREHPQVIAFVLATLDSPKASQVVEHLPEQLHGEVLYRISTMEDIHPSVLGELEEAMRDHVTENSTGAVFNLGGVKFAAELLNRMDTRTEKRILEEIRKIEEPLSQRIEEQLFVFEDLLEVDDRTLQAILKEVTSDVVVLALRGSDEHVKEKFFRNMSERAAAVIQEEMEMRGPVRLKEIEKAQQEFVKTVKALEQGGKINLPGKSGEEVYV
ncbi:MAG: flagellar motor switch protein FliG [bacterium]